MHDVFWIFENMTDWPFAGLIFEKSKNHPNFPGKGI